MTYKMVPTPKFAKSFKKLDPFGRKQIKAYLNRVTDNPRAKGKALVANRTGQWRYRIVPIVLLSIFRIMNSSYLPSKSVIDVISISIKTQDDPDTVNF